MSEDYKSVLTRFPLVLEKDKPHSSGTIAFIPGTPIGSTQPSNFEHDAAFPFAVQGKSR